MSQEKKFVKLGSIIQEFGLEVLHEGVDYPNVPLTTLDVNRPGLPLAGFFEHFDTERLLVMGLTETTYLGDMTPQQRLERFDRLLAYPVPALIFTRGIRPSPECMEMAEKHDRTVLRSTQRTAPFMSSLISRLYSRLAPEITRSGVMLEVYGEGILIQGESGVGKSETAMELIKRGHRLVADDSVLIKKIENELVGTAPEKIRYFMELRGIGIINVKNMYGSGSVMSETEIELVMEMRPWEREREYDRLIGEQNSEEILGVKIPKLMIPISPGRNLAILIEVAARNHRLKSMGYDAAQELIQRTIGR